MNLPLSKVLARKEFIAIAELQDKFIEAIYALDKDLVIHGGTAIWRCYSGNRFSYDIDGYLRSDREMRLVEHDLTWEMSKRGMKIDKYRKTGGSITIQVSDGSTELRVELNVDRTVPKPIVKEFEKADATIINVLTLTPDSLIEEKISTYQSRRYMRDIYDIYHLVGSAKIKGKTAAKLKKFIRDVEPPLNKGELESIVYRGAAPSFKGMVDYIKGKTA